MGTIAVKQFKRQVEEMEHYNSLAPFPCYDTSYIADMKDKIKQMEDNIEFDYDSEPVVACKHCKSLHIIVDELDNTYCGKCGTKNKLEEYSNIFDYKNNINK